MLLFPRTVPLGDEMIVSVNLYPVNIPVNSLIYSRSELLFYNPQDDDNPINYDVGAQLRITKKLYKLHVVETLGEVTLHRYYLTDETLLKQYRYMPIYVVIHTASDCRVLSYRSGITEMWKRYANDAHAPTFVTHRMSSDICNLQVGTIHNRDLIDAWAAYRNYYCPYSADVDNNMPFLTEFNMDPSSPEPWANDDEYGVYMSEMTDQYAFMDGIFDYLNGYQGSNGKLITCHALDYTVPETYSPMAIDVATRRDISNGIVDFKAILSGPRPMNNVPVIEWEYAPVTIFRYDTIILELCSNLMQSGYLELSCTYTLSTGELNVAHAMQIGSRNQVHGAGKFTHLSYILYSNIDKWLSHRDNDIVLKIEISYHHIMRLTAWIYNEHKVLIDKYVGVIDLSIIPVINHTLTS